MERQKNNKTRIIGIVCAIFAVALIVILAVFLLGRGDDTPDPTGTTASATPTESTQPSVPIETTQPSVPTETTQPNVPTETTVPSVPTEPTQPSTPTEPSHQHQWEGNVTPPNCTQGGYTTYTCACGESYADAETEALGHDWQEATCTEPRLCKRCGAIDSMAKGHTWDGGKVTKEPTEKENGEKKFTCTVCGQTKTETIPPKGQQHQHQYESITHEPSCTQGGYTIHTCSCGHSYTDSETPAKGHSWKDATCTEPKTCTVCGATEGTAIDHSWTAATCTAPKTCTSCGTTEGDATGHSYNSVVTDPTEDSQGYTTHTCTICTYSYTDNYKDALTPKHEAGTLLFRANGVAYLYGDNGDVVKTYTDWDGASYSGSSSVPWYNDRKTIYHVIIEEGVADQKMDYWFSDCNKIQSVQLSSSITEIGMRTFYNCTQLRTIEIPATITSIGELAFGNCNRLKSVTFAQNSQLKHIGKTAFAICIYLESFEVPASVTSIEPAAFRYCTSLRTLTVVAGNPVYHSSGNCIIETKTKTLVAGCIASTIPSDGSVTAIGESAFNYCEGLNRITIPSTVTSIGKYAFSTCTTLTGVTIPASVTTIEEGAFRSCKKLRSVSFEAGSKLTSIGDEAFMYCEVLKSIEIPSGVTSIGKNAFAVCYDLESITFQGAIAQWNAISKQAYWNDYVPAKEVICTDGSVSMK